MYRCPEVVVALCLGYEGAVAMCPAPEGAMALFFLILRMLWQGVLVLRVS